MACKIAVIGAGITGLTAAYKLACARRSGALIDECLLEAGPHLGGLIRTEHLEGFTLEAGPDSFLTGKMEHTGLLAELGIESQCIGSNDASRRTYILWRGRLEPLPDGLQFFVPTRLRSIAASRLIPFSSKLAILRDALGLAPSAGGGADESAAGFVRRHLGEGVLQAIADPLLAGVYGGDSEILSARTVLPSLVEMERQTGSVVRGMMKMRKPAGPPGPLFTSLKPGIGELPRALAAQIDRLQDGTRPRFFLNCRVEAVEEMNASGPSRPPRYRLQIQGGDAQEADAVVLALPAPAAAHLLRPLDASLADDLTGIPSTPALTVSVAYHTSPSRLPPGFGFLVPQTEGRALLACTFVHAKFTGRAPEGSVLLRCFLGGARRPEVLDWSDQEITARVQRELSGILGLTEPPLFHHIHRWPQALPQYRMGHIERIERIRQGVSRHPGMFLAGNAYQGVGIPDCIESAKRAVSETLEFARRCNY